jgi:hypothetical protein
MFGMPACLGHVSADITYFVLGAGNRALHTLPLPATAQLVGVVFFHQALVPDPGAPNPGRMVMSDAARAVIGR